MKHLTFNNKNKLINVSDDMILLTQRGLVSKDLEILIKDYLNKNNIKIKYLTY